MLAKFDISHMSFGNPLELFLLARICFLRLMFSVSACLVFVASTECKISPLPSMAIHISVTTCDTCAADYMVRFTRPPRFCILQVIKNWSWGRPGNEATPLLHLRLALANSQPHAIRLCLWATLASDPTYPSCHLYLLTACPLCPRLALDNGQSLPLWGCCPFWSEAGLYH